MRLGRRLLIGLGLAAILVAALALLVPDAERASAGGGAVPPRGRPPGVLERVRGRAVLIYVTTEVGRVPAEGPVVEVGSSGAVRLRRPPPVPDTPRPGPWLAAGIVVPVRRLEDLSAAARVAFLDSLAALAGRGLAVDPDAVVLRGVTARPATLARLVRWCR